jgi:hypothetical protein
MPINHVDPFNREAITQWQQISQRVFRDIPSLNVIWNPLVEANIGIPPWEAHPIRMLFKYVESLTNVCGQVLYAIERLRVFSKREASNTFEFYVAHYLYDFMTRVKTTTDLIALIIDHIFGLNLPDKTCSLESGAFVGKIRSSSPGDQRREQLARRIDRTRNGWLDTFDNLRDIVVHQAGVQLMAVGGAEHAIHVSIPLPMSIPRDVPFTYDPQNPLEALRPFAGEEDWVKFLAQIVSASISEYLITVDPVKLCEEVWRLLSTTTDELLGECIPEIRTFISTHSPPWGADKNERV